MWRWKAIGVGVLSCVLAACGDGAQEGSTEQPLVLELGGDGPTIAEVLRRASPVRSDAADPNPADSIPSAPGGESPEVGPEPAPLKRDAPRPGPEPVGFTIVPLPEGYTLIRLCRERLGDGDRWREVADLNGWSDEELRRLPAGTSVRLPAK